MSHNITFTSGKPFRAYKLVSLLGRGILQNVCTILNNLIFYFYLKLLFCNLKCLDKSVMETKNVFNFIVLLTWCRRTFAITSCLLFVSLVLLFFLFFPVLLMVNQAP